MIRLSIVATCVLALAIPVPSAAEDLMQIYREAQHSDPALAAAQANWQATQERIPQARSGLLPNVSLSVSANANNFGSRVDTDPRVTTSGNFGFGGLTVSAAQPLYRYANTVAYSQAVQQVDQADFTLEAARQDLILRVAGAYFDVLLAQFNVELSASQKAAVSEQLAQAKRNFEVGVATITDTNEAQAKFDRSSRRRSPRSTTREQAHGAARDHRTRSPGTEAPRIRLRANAAHRRTSSTSGSTARATDNLSVGSRNTRAQIATLEIERQRAGHCRRSISSAAIIAQTANGSVNTRISAAINRQLSIGLR